MRMITDHNHPIKRNFRSKLWYNREYPCKSPFLMYICQTWKKGSIAPYDLRLIIKYGVPLITHN
jgi:hypothetical protein